MLKLDLLHNGSLKILLTKQDLDAFGLTFDQMDYDDPSTREALHWLLATAHRETGFDAGDHLLVEALPVDGGCLLLVTPTDSKRRLHSRRFSDPLVYEIADADTLLSLAHSFKHSDCVPPDSSLYGFYDRYRLVVYPAVGAVPRWLPLLSEYTRPVGEGHGAAAYTAEHGRAIIIGNALYRLCTAYSV